MKIKTYKLNSIGSWSTKYDNGVTPSFLIGEIPGSDKLKISSYLKSGEKGIEYFGYAACRFQCEESYTESLGNSNMTDGIYIWPEGLAHHVEKHNIQLPPIFIQHMRNRNFKVEDVDPDLLEYIRNGVDNLGIEMVISNDIWLEWLKENGRG